MSCWHAYLMPDSSAVILEWGIVINQFKSLFLNLCNRTYLSSKPQYMGGLSRFWFDCIIALSGQITVKYCLFWTWRKVTRANVTKSLTELGRIPLNYFPHYFWELSYRSCIIIVFCKLSLNPTLKFLLNSVARHLSLRDIVFTYNLVNRKTVKQMKNSTNVNCKNSHMKMLI